MTTVDDIREWFERGVKENATHMIIVCDTFDFSDFPVYVKEGEKVREKELMYRNGNMQRVMEVYNLQKDMDKQLKSCGKNFNY